MSTFHLEDKIKTPDGIGFITKFGDDETIFIGPKRYAYKDIELIEGGNPNYKFDYCETVWYHCERWLVQNIEVTKNGYRYDLIDADDNNNWITNISETEISDES